MTAATLTLGLTVFVDPADWLLRAGVYRDPAAGGRVAHLCLGPFLLRLRLQAE